MDYNPQEVLTALNKIIDSDKLDKEFRKVYATDYVMIKACIKDNLIKKKAVNLILKLANQSQFTKWWG